MAGGFRFSPILRKVVVSLENGPLVVDSLSDVLAIFIWAGAAAPHDAAVPEFGSNRKSMSSLRRIRASRANGDLSRGPKTPQGKQRSARNSLRHGLLARCVVLQDECPETFAALLADHIARLQPADGLELGMVEHMAASDWRLRRAWALETRLLDKQIAAQAAGPTLDRMADAFSGLAEGPAIALIHRYEARLHLMYQRSLHNLLILRLSTAQTPLPPNHALPNEPSPISEHLLPPAPVIVP
jgi:hypothetical protein